MKTHEIRKKRESQVIDLAKRAGFYPSGWTEERTLIIGEHEVKTPPRRRYILPHTDVRMTVGTHITFFYRFLNEEDVPQKIASFDTYQLAEIADFLLKKRKSGW